MEEEKFSYGQAFETVSNFYSSVNGNAVSICFVKFVGIKHILRAIFVRFNKECQGFTS